MRHFSITAVAILVCTELCSACGFVPSLTEPNPLRLSPAPPIDGGVSESGLAIKYFYIGDYFWRNEIEYTLFQWSPTQASPLKDQKNWKAWFCSQGVPLTANDSATFNQTNFILTVVSDASGHFYARKLLDGIFNLQLKPWYKRWN